jgi:hypothetical protein
VSAIFSVEGRALSVPLLNLGRPAVIPPIHFSFLRSCFPDSTFLVRLCIWLLALSIAPAIAFADFREFKAVPIDAELSAKLTRAAEASLKDFPRLTADNLALSVIDLTKPDAPIRADYHGDVPFYPASVIKLFFMVEAYHQGKLTPEIERALREMIHSRTTTRPPSSSIFLPTPAAARSWTAKRSKTSSIAAGN